LQNGFAAIPGDLGPDELGFSGETMSCFGLKKIVLLERGY